MKERGGKGQLLNSYIVIVFYIPTCRSVMNLKRLRNLFHAEAARCIGLDMS